MGTATLLLTHAWCEASALTWGHGLVGGALWCLLGGLFLRTLSRRCVKPRWLLAMGCGIFMAHFVWDMLMRQLWGMGSGAEYLLLAGLVNTGFFLLGRKEPRLSRLALPLSLGVAVFGISLSQGWLGSVYGTAYLVLAVLALLRLPKERGSARHFSLVMLLLPILGVFLVGTWLASGQPSFPLSGFLWGSGGGAKSDPFGRGGIGNGEGEVAATQKTEDIGFANTDITVESDKRTLFDAVSELYGEPEPPKKTGPMHRKASFLAKDILEKPKEPQVAPSASKGFSTRRSQGKPAAKTKNDPAKALLYVSGRTPLHLRLTGYDTYEDSIWHEGSISREKNILQNQGGDWMGFSLKMQPAIFGAEEYHEVKVGQLVTDRLPTPLHLLQVRIDRLNQSDFYRWAQRGILQLDNIPQVPAGVKLELRSKTLDYAKLDKVKLAANPNFSRSTYYRLPRGCDPRIAQLARQWVEGVPQGWPQVQAVVQQLRRYASHVPSMRPPQGTDDEIAWFLFEGRKGPDYLFATSAALLLRSLGYPTRVVNGLYVSGKARDIKTGHSLVMGHDLHFWVEVESQPEPNIEATWILFEVTPGYDVASPLPTLADHIRRAVEGARHLVSQHLLVLVSCSILLGLAWRFRSALQEVLWLAHWHTFACRHPESAVRWGLLLLEGRARRSGTPRPSGTTLQNHYRQYLQLALPDEGRALEQLLATADSLLYAPHQPLAPEAIDHTHQVLRLWTRRRLKETAPPL